MYCYSCEKTERTGGFRYGVRAAVGSCHGCGIGVCIMHSHKSSDPGAPLLCLDCAARCEETPAAPKTEPAPA